MYEVGEINFEHLFVDGTKIEANANKYSFVWKKSTNKYQARLNKQIERFKAEINAQYGYAFNEESPLSEVCEVLKKEAVGVRFFSADSLFMAGDALVGTNMYAYCLNNPVMYVDPSGYKPFVFVKRKTSQSI